MFPKRSTKVLNKNIIKGWSLFCVCDNKWSNVTKKKYQNKEVTNVNLEGFAIGNGYFSGILGINSAISLTYFRGMHSKKYNIHSWFRFQPV